jgi:hypothetical protein
MGQSLKGRIRRAAEEDREFYTRRAPQEWLDALTPIGTDAHTPFLETAPYLIVVFAQPHGMTEDGATVPGSPRSVSTSSPSG